MSSFASPAFQRCFAEAPLPLHLEVIVKVKSRVQECKETNQRKTKKLAKDHEMKSLTPH